MNANSVVAEESSDTAWLRR